MKIKFICLNKIVLTLFLVGVFIPCSYAHIDVNIFDDILHFFSPQNQLKVRQNGIKRTNIKELCKIYKEHKQLSRFEFVITDDIGLEGAKDIADAFYGSAWTTLRLLGGKIGNDGAIAIANVLRTNHILTALELVNNNIGTAGVLAIVYSLLSGTNHTLTELILDGNGIDDEGALAIAKLITENETLTTLSLERNNIGAEGREYLVNAIIQNTTLTNIQINNLSPNQEQILKLVLERNIVLTNLMRERGVQGARLVLSAIMQGIPANMRDLLGVGDDHPTVVLIRQLQGEIEILGPIKRLENQGETLSELIELVRKELNATEAPQEAPLPRQNTTASGHNPRHRRDGGEVIPPDIAVLIQNLNAMEASKSSKR